MKSFILICSLMIILTEARASIEHMPGDEAVPSATEINQNRACFSEVSRNGCEDPGVNLREFRSCLHNVFPKLSDSCRRMMSDLYRRRR